MRKIWSSLQPHVIALTPHQHVKTRRRRLCQASQRTRKLSQWTPMVSLSPTHPLFLFRYPPMVPLSLHSAATSPSLVVQPRGARFLRHGRSWCLRRHQTR
ncbi:hypothetical protein SLE2022_251120 [Rubroshorea leprosula]